MTNDFFLAMYRSATGKALPVEIGTVSGRLHTHIQYASLIVTARRAVD
jgi:hypothetical protein